MELTEGDKHSAHKSKFLCQCNYNIECSLRFMRKPQRPGKLQENEHAPFEGATVNVATS